MEILPKSREAALITTAGFGFVLRCPTIATNPKDSIANVDETTLGIRSENRRRLRNPWSCIAEARHPETTRTGDIIEICLIKRASFYVILWCIDWCRKQGPVPSTVSFLPLCAFGSRIAVRLFDVRPIIFQDVDLLSTCLRHSRHRADDRNSLITLLTTPKNRWLET